ncbi:MAG: hypothetical protein KatS3mg044_0544 [Rhodothermaceae bacterium]|nr:MAG: hypothetical protein D6746_11730 [Bacteroidota bacterium]GIV61678.1 MAG: hypothetical protein KatS3mg044_0544 [Rhodothermaceae bacterium]
MTHHLYWIPLADWPGEEDGPAPPWEHEDDLDHLVDQMLVAYRRAEAPRTSPPDPAADPGSPEQD